MKSELQSLTIEIFNLCIIKNISLEVEWIPREQNQTAVVYKWVSLSICGGAMRSYRKWYRAHAWPEVTSPKVTWLFPSILSPYFFSRTFFPYFFSSFFFVPFSLTFFPVLFIPVFFPRRFFSQFFFLSSSTQCWLGCSLRRPRPITIGNYPPFIFIFYSVYVLQGCLRPITFYEITLIIICPFYFQYYISIMVFGYVV